MKIAYIIHAYKLPNQLTKLVSSLESPDTYLFIHIDKKIDIKPFEQALINNKNIVWVKREYSNWGTIKSIQAILNAFFEALNHKENFEYFYCLSGQDYPIKTQKYIAEYLEKNKNTDYIKYFPLPSNIWKGGGMHRYNRIHFIISKNRYIRRIVNTINFFLPRRKIPYNLKPFGGEFYFSFSRKSVAYILNFIKDHPLYIPFFKYSYIPEEIFFQTILLNGPKEITNNINNGILTYVDWNNPKAGLPAVLMTPDFEKLKNSEMLFARKFDINKDKEILGLINNKLLK